MFWMSTLMAVNLVVRTNEYLYRLLGAPSNWQTSEENIWKQYPYVMKRKGISEFDESGETMVNLQQVMDEAPFSSYITVYGITDSSSCKAKYFKTQVCSADDILKHLKSCYNQLK
eukprot:NODE_434_length_7483_cov_0.351165.p7 type:complete len:115 gc:universal NODE_434_length_7483_cov_0.351165:3242-3586(+)